ncbi:hypothetical protein QTP88_000289 [Uroleucon formosanum]
MNDILQQSRFCAIDYVRSSPHRRSDLCFAAVSNRKRLLIDYGRIGKFAISIFPGGPRTRRYANKFTAVYCITPTMTCRRVGSCLPTLYMSTCLPTRHRVCEPLKSNFLIAYTMIKRVLNSGPEIIQVRLQV